MATWQQQQATAANWRVWLMLSSLQKKGESVNLDGSAYCYWYCGNRFMEASWHQNDSLIVPLCGGCGGVPTKKAVNAEPYCYPCCYTDNYHYMVHVCKFKSNFYDMFQKFYFDLSSSCFSELPFLLVLGYYQLKLILPVSQWLAGSFENPIIRLFV